MQVIIDRFEEDIAVIEADGRMLNAPRALFPGAHEGDAVEITVLGKTDPAASGSVHAIFARLRDKSRAVQTRPEPCEADQNFDGFRADQDT